MENDNVNASDLPAASDPKPDKPKKLTPKERLFVREYLIDYNATQAVKRAGYKSKAPSVFGSMLLAKDKISAAVAEVAAAREKRVEINGDMVIRELALLGFQNTKNLFDEHGRLIPINRLPDEIAKTISSIEVTSRDVGGGQTEQVTKVRLWDKKGSLELLGKYLKLFTDKTELTGKDGAPIFGDIIIVAGRDG